MSDMQVKQKLELVDDKTAIVFNDFFEQHKDILKLREKEFSWLSLYIPAHIFVISYLAILCNEKVQLVEVSIPKEGFLSFLQIIGFILSLTCLSLIFKKKSVEKELVNKKEKMLMFAETKKINTFPLATYLYYKNIYENKLEFNGDYLNIKKGIERTFKEENISWNMTATNDLIEKSFFPPILVWNTKELKAFKLLENQVKSSIGKYCAFVNLKEAVS